jgi:putative flippase GtrA
VKFAVIGGLSVVVNAIVFNLLLFLPVFDNGELKAKVVATAVAMVSSYFMNRHWTYGDRDKSAAHREFMLFVGFNLAGLLIELAIMGVTKYWFGLTSWLAINAAFVIGLGLGTVFRFFTYRRYVFLHAPEVHIPAPAPAVETQFAELTAPLEAEFAGAAKRVPRGGSKKRGAGKNPAPIR